MRPNTQPQSDFQPTSFLVSRPKCGCARAKTSDIFTYEIANFAGSTDCYLNLARTRTEARICFHLVHELGNEKRTLAVMPRDVADDPDKLAQVVRAVLLANGDDEVYVFQSAPTHLYLGNALDEERLKAVFLETVTFDDGGRPDEHWWEDATWRWRESQRIAADPNSRRNRIVRVAEQVRGVGVDEHGLALQPVAIDRALARSFWLCDLCTWTKDEGRVSGSAAVLPIHEGITFLLVVDIQHTEGDVCEAIALLPREVGMDLRKLPHLLHKWASSSRTDAELVPQSAGEVVPALISRERIDAAFNVH
jgi:hypothetical protein